MMNKIDEYKNNIQWNVWTDVTSVKQPCNKYVQLSGPATATLAMETSMEVKVHLDGDPAVRKEGFFASQVSDLQDRVHDLEYDNAELVKANEELAERVKKLATQRPSGFRSRRNTGRRKDAS